MKFKLILVLLLFGVLGYVREFFFVQMNVILYQKYYNSVNEEFPVAKIMQIFNNFTYETLYYSKYIFTLISVGLFYILSFYSFKYINLLKNIKYLNYCYLLLLTLATLSMLYGYFINNRLQDSEYTLSRWLLGIAQSPIVFIILFAANKLNNTLTKTNEL